MIEAKFTSFSASIQEALEQLGVPAVLAGEERIIVKPNLVNASAPPITTPVECTEALIHLIRQWSTAEIIIAEGCGAAEMETPEVFSALGYTHLAEQTGVGLLDLNTAETVRLENPECEIFPEFHLPRIALESYIISVPVLKAHSYSQVTGSMKNMMGFAPPSHYQQGGYWKKSAFHAHMHESITELNRYRSADLTVMDATVGMPEFHLGGAICDPPLGRILAGFDPKEVDRRGAELLGMNWEEIGHLL